MNFRTARSRQTKPSGKTGKHSTLKTICSGMTLWLVASVVLAFLLTGCEAKTERKKLDLQETTSKEELEQLQPKRDQNVFVFGFDGSVH